MKLINHKKCFFLLLICFGVSAAMPLLTPFAIEKNGELSGVGYVAGVMFWAGLIAGCIGYIWLSRTIRGAEPLQDIRKRTLPGLKFFSNVAASIADGLMIAGVMGTVFCAIKITVNQFIAVALMFFALAGIYGHFLFNGKLYANTVTEEKAEEESEQLEEQGYEEGLRQIDELKTESDIAEPDEEEIIERNEEDEG